MHRKQADAFMRTGQLVPDELIIRMVQSRLAEEGGLILPSFNAPAGRHGQCLSYLCVRV